MRAELLSSNKEVVIRLSQLSLAFLGTWRFLGVHEIIAHNSETKVPLVTRICTRSFSGESRCKTMPENLYRAQKSLVPGF
jgi:uncharacterized protein VirK/YbjX